MTLRASRFGPLVSAAFPDRFCEYMRFDAFSSCRAGAGKVASPTAAAASPATVSAKDN
jgi:hypothetical protein